MTSHCRLARALAHGALGRIGNLAGPALALAPAFYRNGAKLAGALCDLSALGDWGQFNSVFSNVMRDALSLTARVQ
ncbi:MAG TPA: hypothetical protein VIZ66_03055 [Sphingomicrobium sp.]